MAEIYPPSIHFLYGKSALVVTAIHSGHYIRPQLLPKFSLTGEERLREEDPYTDRMVMIADNRISTDISRFEVDLNRPWEKSVYIHPEDAWGLKLYRSPLADYIVKRSLEMYDLQYARIASYFDRLVQENSFLIVYDFHSYNYKREGPDKEGSPEENPDINLGTQNMNRELWDPVIARLTGQLREFDFGGRRLDVRENIRFKGGYFSKFLYDRYGDKVCAIAIEIKKFFMEEWTGIPDLGQIDLLEKMFAQTVEPVLGAAKSTVSWGS